MSCVRSAAPPNSFPANVWAMARSARAARRRCLKLRRSRSMTRTSIPMSAAPDCRSSSISGPTGAVPAARWRRSSKPPPDACAGALRQGRYRSRTADRRAFRHPQHSDADAVARRRRSRPTARRDERGRLRALGAVARARIDDPIPASGSAFLNGRRSEPRPGSLSRASSRPQQHGPQPSTRRIGSMSDAAKPWRA